MEQNLVTMYQTVVGVLLPIIIATINKPDWSKYIKFYIAFFLCVVAAGIEVFYMGEFSLSDWPVSFLKILFITVGSYKVFWHGSGITDLIERNVNG